MTRRKDFMVVSKSSKGPESDLESSEKHLTPDSAVEIPSDSTELENKLQEKTKEADENYARLLRMAADMENMKKRQERDRAELLQFANENLIKELLPVVDNLERALEHGRQMETAPPLLEGIDMVHQGFIKALGKFGVTPIESVGQQFDPAYHNAVMQEETDQVPDCSVTKELQKGYLMNQRLLRPAMVVVARCKQHDTANTSCQTDSTVQEEK
jgi:molecular chaperone GrpE